MADVISLSNIRSNAATYGWLTPLVVSLDAITAASLLPAADRDPSHDPYQVEDHLEEIGRLLDNCLAYRREIYELQAQATKTALEYELFSKQLDALKKLEIAEGVAKQLAAQRGHYTNAVAGFTEVGFKANSSASLAATVAGLAWEEQRTGLVKTKWELVEQYQKSLNARHSESGNALNYVERFNRVLAFYKEDVTTAYELARAVSAGLRIVADINTSLPPINNNNYLDKLIEWNRAVVKQFNKFHREDVQSEITIPLRHLSSLRTNYSDQMKEDGAGELQFDLTDYFNAGIKNLRLKGVALSFGVNSPEGTALAFQHVGAVIVPPNTIDPFGAAPTEKTIPRHPLLVQAAIGNRSVPVEYVSSTNTNNVNPRGQWTIIVSKKIIVSDGEDRPKRTEAKFKNFYLHLLVASQLTNSGIRDFQL